jgi:hypothetical protein
MIDTTPPAVIVYADVKPVYSIFHDGVEYWVYEDHGVYKTCNGTIVRLTAQERKLQRHPERVEVSCNDNRLDAHALHPTPTPKPRHPAHRF